MEIEFGGPLSKREYLEASYWHARSRFRHLIYINFFILLSIVGAFLIAPEISGYLLSVVLILLLVFSSPWWIPLIQVAVGWKEELRGKASEEGLNIKTAKYDITVRWEAYTFVRGKEDYVLLYQTPNGFTLLLKSYFDDHQAWNQFLALVRSKIRNFQEPNSVPLLKIERITGVEGDPHRYGSEAFGVQLQTRGVFIRRLECESCFNVVRNGSPRFGPSQVVCGFCGTTLETGLTPWESLSMPRRAVLVISEFISSSRLGGGILGVFLPAFGAGIAFTIWFFIGLDGNEPLAWSFCLAGLSIYFLFIPLRLIRMILESNRYSDNEEVPVWKTDA